MPPVVYRSHPDSPQVPWDRILWLAPLVLVVLLAVYVL